MKAVVLVGGFGTRLRPLTDDVPKPMLTVGHDPMIVSLVQRLADAGVDEVVLALGFQPEPFQSAFPDDRFGPVSIHYAVEPEPLDTGGAIGFAARDAGIEETFMVLNGDNICDVDYSWLVEQHRAGGRLATIHLTPVDDPSAFGVVETDADGVVERFVEKPGPGETTSNVVNSGAYVFEPEVLDLIEPGRRISVERETFPALVERRQLDAVVTDDYWTDTGRPELFLAANLALIDGTRTVTAEAVHSTATVAADAVVINSVIGADARIGSQARIVDSVILPGANIAAAASIERSLVAGTVLADARVVDSVIGSTIEVAGEIDSARLPEPVD